MKRYFSYLLVFIIFVFSFVSLAYAYGYDVSVTSKNVTVGNTVTLTIKVTGIFGRFDISSSNSSVVSAADDHVWAEGGSGSLTLNAKSVGSAVITITPSSISTDDKSPRDVTLSAKTITITVNAKTSTSYVKSANSYLTSLSVDGYELDTEFDKEVTDYSVTVDEGTEKIKINAQLEDSGASVTGTGEVDVSDGENKFSLVVTAENGSKRTYNLNVTVKEYDPIKVTVDGESYTIVRKKKDLPMVSEYFHEDEFTIDDEVIPGYTCDITKDNLVGLKDSEGNIKLFIYQDGKYTKYNEQTFNGITIHILDKEIEGYLKTSFTYNDTKITAYQETRYDLVKNAQMNEGITNNNFYLFYGINLATGEEAIYQYDAKEMTVQRYNLDVIDMYRDLKDEYYLYLLVGILLFGAFIIIMMLVSIVSGRKRRKKHQIIDNKVNYKEEDNQTEEIISFKDEKINESVDDNIIVNKDSMNKPKTKKKKNKKGKKRAK